MKRTVQHSLLLLFVGLSIVPAVSADKVCLSSQLTRQKKIKHKATVVADSAKCPRGSTLFLTSNQVTNLVMSNVQVTEGGSVMIGVPGPQGAQGPAGPQGPTGPQGPSGAADIIGVSRLSPSNSDSPKVESVPCPSGYTVLGGNASVVAGLFSYYDGVKITYASPSLTGSEFVARGVESPGTTDSWALFLSAICKKQ